MTVKVFFNSNILTVCIYIQLQFRGLNIFLRKQVLKIHNQMP